MKRLLIALVAAVAVSTGFAKLTYTQGFEGESYNPSTDFVPSVANEDASEIANHGTAPSVTVPYNFGGFGDKYYELDTGNATLWYTNEGSAPYFDMVMQFNPSATQPELESDTKIAVYVNASSNLVVISGDGSGGRDINTYPSRQLSPGTWARLTIAATERENKFAVYLDNQKIGDFAPLTGDASINSIGFKGSGSLDDFVARTTDPFYTGEYVASIGNGGEKYATLDAALADNPTATFKLNANATTTTVLANRGDSISIELNGHSLSGLTAAGLLLPVKSVSGDVTTYTADYFPRTETAGQDGTAAHPFEIADEDGLNALREAVADADADFRNKCYVMTADIALTSSWPGIGIQNGKDLVSYNVGTGSGDITQEQADLNDASYASGAFRGTFDGQNHTISGFQMVGVAGNPANNGEGLDYGGFFNSILGATIKNLKIQYLSDKFAVDTSATTKESGATFVGVAKDSTLVNLTTLSGTVACSKGFGGIVGYLMGTSVDSCTNNVNMSSLNVKSGVTGNKCGGIAMICQKSGCSISNCENNGTMTTGSGEHGGIIGYTDTIAITNCNNTAACKMLYHHGGTVTLGGVNKGNATVVSYTGNATPGLNFATVDGSVATFVSDSALVDGNTYKVMSTKAAATYNFDAAGTIAFDTAVAVPASTNITADTTTLVLADPVTVDTVTTYSATAGVASVDDFAYSTFDEAVAALDGAEDDFVTLLADVTKTMPADITLKVKTNSHIFTPAVAADVILTSSTDEYGVTTYSTTEGVAAVSTDGDNWTWYSTFESAYAAAIRAGYQPDFKIKVGADFTPTFPDVSSLYEYLWTIEFIATTESPISISLTDGVRNMVSARTLKIPANATLTAISQELSSISGGGALVIPDDVTLTVGTYNAFNGVSSITGGGTIIAPPNPSSFIGNSTVQGLLKASSWTGTLQLSNVVSSVWSLSNLGNASSTIRFNGLTTYLNSGTHSVGTIELVGDGLTINGNYSNGTWTFPGALTGSGALNISIANASGTDLKAVKFTGDASGFAGSIDFGENANAYVQFGAEGVDNTDPAAKRIVTGDDAVVTVAAGKSWKSSNFMLHGNVTLNGNLRNIDDTDAGVVWNNHSSAVLTANAAGLFKFGSNVNWTGRYVVNHTLASADTAFVIPTHANATTVINGDENGEFAGFPSTGSGAPTVAGNIVLNANWTTGDGYSGDANATTFASLSGSGNLTVNDKNSYSYKLVYNLTKLDGYTGTLGGRNGKFVIEQVNVAEMPADGARVVKTACGTYGEIAGDLKLYVAGDDTGKTLVYDAAGTEGAGLYYVIPKNYVAQNGTTSAKYETIVEALEAASTGDTITLLADTYERVYATVNNNVTLDINGKTMTSPADDVIVMNGSGVLTIQDTAETLGLVQSTINDLDCGVAVWARQGSVVIKSGVFENDSNYEATVYVSNGAGCTIEGGTFRNVATGTYHWKTTWAPITLNVQNGHVSGSAAISVSGGSFTTNPANGDDSFGGTFLASGYKATESAGVWIVSEDTGTPLEPGQKSTEYDTAEAATNAMAIVEVAVPSDVDSALDAGKKADYVAMFEKKVVDNGDGTYSVAVEMKDEVVAEVQTAVDDATATTLEKVLDVEAGADANVSVTTKPGLYYAIAVGTSLPLTAPASEAYEMATDTTKTLKVTKPTTGTAAFFRVYCSETK